MESISILMISRQFTSEQMMELHDATIEKFNSSAQTTGSTIKHVTYGEFNKDSLDGIDCVYFRSVGNKRDEASSIARLAINAGLPIFDRYIEEDVAKNGKVLRRSKKRIHELMSKAGMNLPDTKFISLSELKQMDISDASGKILKVLVGGRRGTGTYYINNEEKLNQAIDDIESKPNKGKHGLMLQDFIRNDGDFRLIVVNGIVVASTKRKPKVDFNRLHFNKSAGKSTSINAVPYALSKECSLIPEHIGIDFASVDAVRCLDSGNYYLVDINSAPSFGVLQKRTKVDIPSELISMMSFEVRRRKVHGGNQN